LDRTLLTGDDRLFERYENHEICDRKETLVLTCQLCGQSVVTKIYLLKTMLYRLDGGKAGSGAQRAACKSCKSRNQNESAILGAIQASRGVPLRIGSFCIEIYRLSARLSRVLFRGKN
jgi:hypothetical protein